MSICGYLCPKCEGKGFTDDGETCDWCVVETVTQKKKEAISDEEWQRSVHEGNCCAGDPEESDQKSEIRDQKSNTDF
ncbi:MAG: hypothetical protein JWO58_902 [Chitinophagaceae bacterium]|nr:hypothetical protein [Chitinophagaceae bacterium]